VNDAYKALMDVKTDSSNAQAKGQRYIPSILPETDRL